jgi:hypothetical protein
VPVRCAVPRRNQRDKVLQTLANELADVQSGIAEILGEEETRKKALEEILAEPGEDKSALEKCAGMALEGLRQDAARFSGMAGEASAGNISRCSRRRPVGAPRCLPTWSPASLKATPRSSGRRWSRGPAR